MDLGRAQVRVSTTVDEGGATTGHSLVLDTPRGTWSMEDLHELAQTVAGAAGILNEYATTVAIEISLPRAAPDSSDDDHPARRCLEPDDSARFVLDFLIARHPVLLSIEELVREFSGAENPRAARIYVEDGLAELVRSGLVNRLDNYVFASRAAMRASELAL